MHISKPYHSERRTFWYVQNGENCVATLELGQRYRSDSGAVYRLREVDCRTGQVTVIRDEVSHVWHVSSLINGHMELLACEHCGGMDPFCQSFAVGSTVRYSNPTNERESAARFEVVEPRGPRVLIRLICELPIAPTEVVAVGDVVSV